MTNIKTEVNGNELIIRVNLEEDHGPSKSGKTTIIASSHGAGKVGDVSVNLNVYKRR